jgi:tripeptidyl-peptidase-1
MGTLKAPSGWTAQGAAPRGHLLELVFAVKQTNTERLEAALMNAADPDSAQYGKWLSNEQVHELVAPAPSSRETVRAFLRGHGVTDFADATPNGDFIAATVTAAQAESLLGAKYEAFRHGVTGQVVHRTRSYALPADVAAVVDFVSPTIQLPTIRATTESPMQQVGGEEPALGNTPDSLRKLYNVGSEMGGASPKTKQAVTAFL